MNINSTNWHTDSQTKRHTSSSININPSSNHIAEIRHQDSSINKKAIKEEVRSITVLLVRLVITRSFQRSFGLGADDWCCLLKVDDSKQ